MRDGDDLEVGPPFGRDDDDDVVVGKRHGVTLPLPPSEGLVIRVVAQAQGGNVKAGVDTDEGVVFGAVESEAANVRVWLGDQRCGG